MATATLIGGLLGLSGQLYCNAIRKLPLMRNPWEHVIAIGIGAAFGDWVVRYEEATAADVRGEAGVHAESVGQGLWEGDGVWCDNWDAAKLLAMVWGGVLLGCLGDVLLRPGQPGCRCGG